MSDFDIGSALSWSARSTERLRKVAARQLEEAQKASGYAKETADAAKEAAKAEQELLSIDRRRFQAEQQERSHRQETQQKQKRARQILSDVIVQVSHIPSSSECEIQGTLDLTLSRTIAVVQAKIEILESIKDAFLELSDMTEFRKLKSKIAKLVEAYSANGVCTPTPLQDANAELEELYAFAARASALNQIYLQFGSGLFDRESPPISYEAWSEYWQGFQTLREVLATRLCELRETNRSSLWNDGGLPSQELMALDAVGDLLLDAESNVAQTDQFYNWHLFSLEQGPFYAELTAHLERVGSRLEDSQKNYETDQPKWKRALAVAQAGNYLTAKRILSECSNEIVDDSYQQCIDETQAWEESLRGYKEEPQIIGIERAVLTPLPFLPFTLPREIKAREALLTSVSKWLRFQQGASKDYKGTEYGDTLNAILLAHYETTVSVSKTLNSLIRKQYITLVSVALTGLLVLLSTYFTWTTIQASSKAAAIEAVYKAQEAQKAAQKAAEAEEIRSAEAERKLEQAKIARHNMEAMEAEQAEIAKKAEQQKQNELVRQEAISKLQRERDSIQALVEKFSSEKTNQLKSHGKLYGRQELTLRLYRGDIMLRRGAQYDIIGRESAETVRVKPSDSMDDYRYDDNSRYPRGEIVADFATGADTTVTVFIDFLTADPDLRY